MAAALTPRPVGGGERDNDTPLWVRMAVLRPFPAEAITARLANPIVNKATAEGPECLATPPSDLPMAVV